jgi:hypothetical protein
MADFVQYQDVECIYPMSGQYGQAPRALYYALLIFVIGFRRQDWLTAGAAAYCLTFGGSAAIHALILAPILSLGKPPISPGLVQLPNSTILSITPLASDLDSDATLAIVGTGFLIVIPMALWSERFRHSGAVSILVLWILLMFVGMISCMINAYAINGSPSGPLLQYRFCSPGYNDTYPFSGNLPALINDSWNDTIWTYFSSRTTSMGSCVYPCLSATELLRQPGDARAIHFLRIAPPSLLFWAMDIVTAVVYSCVPLTMLFAIFIFILRLRGHTSSMSFSLLQSSDWRTRTRKIIIWAVNVYGKILIPFVFVVFLVWAEWIIAYDLQSESMQLVGQCKFFNLPDWNVDLTTLHFHRGTVSWSSVSFGRSSSGKILASTREIAARISRAAGPCKELRLGRRVLGVCNTDMEMGA